MKENPIIVPVQLNQTKQAESISSKIHPSCQFQMNGTEVTFYNEAYKYILNAVLAEIFKYTR